MYSGYRIERRKFKRLQVNLSVLYRVMAPRSVRESTHGEEFEGKTIDLSEGGMAMISTQNLPEGTKLFCKFVIFESNPAGLPDFHEVLVVFGEVRSSLELQERFYRLGVYFEIMDKDKKEKIMDIVRSPLKYESPLFIEDEKLDRKLD